MAFLQTALDDVTVAMNEYRGGDGERTEQGPMAFFVISPPDETDWKFDRGLLVQRLERDWPRFTLSGPDGDLPTRDVIWSYHGPDGHLEGSQDRAGQAQYLTGSPGLIARYAIWWRQQVDPAQPLILYDEGFSTSVPLAPDTTEAEIIEAL